MKLLVSCLLILSLSSTLGWAGKLPFQLEPVDSRQQQFNSLFLELRYAPDQPRAVAVERKIWMLWLQSGNQQIDQLMKDAMDARRWYDFDRALDLLDQVVALDPKYPEAWNQRAIVHFFRGDHHQSLVDISKALELEPRHFGALAGRGVIRLQQGKAALAFQNIKAAMQYHPYLQERQLFPVLMKQSEILAP
ncbi:MAG: hypothetical protein OQK12_17480 [Motiliproteus sp.]|nr:hypothetical protein [Motiliproteus sp.]MCW9054074.1 hypothetical protein [Motiliproteus sp.]